jgi:hypothetical protein
MPNEDGFRDGRLSTILLRDQHDGKPLAAIWSMACHPISSPGQNSVRPDYPGEIRKMLRNHFKNDIPVVFILGFSGDINPPSYAKVEKITRNEELPHFILTKAIAGKSFAEFDESGWSAYLKSIWDSMESSFRKDTLTEIESNIEVKTEELPLSKLGLVTDKNLKMCSIKIGRVRIIAMSAEVVAEWNPILSKIFPDEIIMTTSCLEDVYGYLPTEGMIKDGGYEVDEFQETFNISGEFKFGMEKEITSYLYKLK